MNSRFCITGSLEKISKYRWASGVPNNPLSAKKAGKVWGAENVRYTMMNSLFLKLR
jgi:hypothetical protein